MKFRIVTEYDPETKSYAAYCPELPGCCSAGQSYAVENVIPTFVPVVNINEREKRATLYDFAM
jgi:hypothetical protein